VRHTPRWILIIDDCLEQAECLARLLEALGHSTTFVINPLDGLDVADAIRPELTFIDIEMPHMDGCRLGRILRERFPDMRLVAVTGLDPARHTARIADAGFAGCLVKPVALDELRLILPAASNQA
jgi:CheY-like chemotaxis protein